MRVPLSVFGVTALGAFWAVLPAAGTAKLRWENRLDSGSDKGQADAQEATQYESPATLLERYGNHYHWMPKEKVLVCGCAKCGSTSLYDFMYKEAFGQAWNYSGPPFIQDVTASRWAGKFQLLLKNETEMLLNKSDTFSFALIRDPKKRIISAWKSKIACDGSWGTDVRDREGIVPKLLMLANRSNASCLSLYSFLDAVNAVHKAGRAKELNSHFRPQNLGCFRHFPPHQWRKVVSIGEAGAAKELAARFGDLNQTDFPHAHKSNEMEPITISPAAMRLLDEVTEAEYKALGLSR